MIKPFPLQDIKDLKKVVIEITAPTAEDKRWGCKIVEESNGLKYATSFYDDTYHWLEEKMRGYIGRVR
jgi:hypothetical protein